MKLTSSKKYLKYIWIAVLIFIIGNLFFYWLTRFTNRWQVEYQWPLLWRPPIVFEKKGYISPLVVEAKEPDPIPEPKTWDEIAHLVIDEWKDLGKEKTMSALKIAYCESRWNEKVLSPVNAVGVFQIHPYDEEMFDALTNIRKGKEKYLTSGWQPWTDWGSCRP